MSSWSDLHQDIKRNILTLATKNDNRTKSRLLQVSKETNQLVNLKKDKLYTLFYTRLWKEQPTQLSYSSRSAVLGWKFILNSEDLLKYGIVSSNNIECKIIVNMIVHSDKVYFRHIRFFADYVFIDHEIYEKGAEHVNNTRLPYQWFVAIMNITQRITMSETDYQFPDEGNRINMIGHVQGKKMWFQGLREKLAEQNDKQVISKINTYITAYDMNDWSALTPQGSPTSSIESPQSHSQKHSRTKLNLMENYQNMEGVLGHKEAVKTFLKSKSKAESKQYNGKEYRVHDGSKGGRYIIANGKKIYVSKSKTK